MLEHHAHIFPHLVEVGFFVGQVVTVHNDLAGGDVLQPVQASQEGGFAAAGGAENDHHLALIDVGGNILQHFQLAEVLFQVRNVNLHIVLIHAHGSVSFPAALPDGTAA